MSVSIRNRELLAVSSSSVVRGAVLVVITAPFGILWCAVALLFRHLASLGWMAAILRHEIMRPVREYFTGLVTPFVLMLAASLAAREVIGDAATGDGVAQQVLMLLGSVAG